MFLDYNDSTANIHRIHCPNGCGRSYTGFRMKTILKRHLMLECGVNPQFQCYLCKKRYTRKSSLKSHIIVVHKLLI